MSELHHCGKFLPPKLRRPEKLSASVAGLRHSHRLFVLQSGDQT